MTTEELKAILALAAQYPNVSFRVVVNLSDVSEGSTPPTPPPPPPTSYPVCKIEAGSKPSQQVKVRPEPSPSIGGPTLQDGTPVYHIEDHDTTANQISWKYVRSLDGVIQGFVQENELVCP